MAEGSPPLALLRRLEAVCEGEPADEIIFCMGLIVGRIIVHTTQPEHHLEVVEACVDAIRAGIDGPMTEH